MEKWVLSAKKADFRKIAEQFNIDAVTAALIRNRDIIGAEEIKEYLHGNLQSLHNPLEMKDVSKATQLLEQAISQGKRIRVIGDYDIDGIMSSYILLQGLTAVSAKVDVAIPHRINDGYGINIALIEQAAQDGIDTIITCDNGISAKEQIAVAKELGLTVIITDHHEVPYQEEGGERREVLPPADAILNPKQAECPYPFKELCGAGVAYKLIIAVYQHFNLPENKHEELLEYVAIATIGDVMDLVGENRILVKEGLKCLQHTPNRGLQALIKVNKLELGNISTYHIGFVLGPCLNASGRLDVAMRGLELLKATDDNQAAVIAGDLKSLNDTRKEMTAEGLEAAIAAVEEGTLSEDRVLVVYLPDCHESLAGIIAGRLRERYYKPTFILTNGEEGVKGSGRSIEAYSMYEEMVKCQELFDRFGGHPMAAGLSLNAHAGVEQFRHRINEQCTLTADDLTEKVKIDVAMPLSYIRRELITEMELLQPFGKGNSKPVFAQKNITLQGPRILGKNQNVVKMKAIDEHGFAMDALYFGDGEEFLAKISGEQAVAITYYPAINSYMGKETLQVTISHVSK